MYIPASMRSPVLTLSLGLLLVTGCGDGTDPNRRTISGRVTFQGKPVPQGEIRFAPVAAGSASAARITDGNFEISHRGGVMVGESTVSIVATSQASSATQEELDSGVDLGAAMTIPSKYNTQTELRVEIEPGEGTQAIDFDLVD
ncbi:hypothetical protein EC9_01490 [Rosistilla ulvae]|uniref:Carboxypeptidase regulatory-like domain-containing protein n=1 Tax=Rosistilla ulvae TaxID=1930277 RepID=A0A517LTN8_9BACT|nr:hypothetical protein [Rosistilla ulvae]QDS85991.1 hypothetical protein EC9_01490 [Rosistilla ulvae]